MASPSEIRLTPTQEQVAEQAIDALGGLQRNFVVIEGLSGVGKSSVLESIRSSVEEAGGKVIDERDLAYGNPLEIKEHRHLVTSGTLGVGGSLKTLGRIAEGFLPEFNQKNIVLPGMTDAETFHLIRLLRPLTLSYQDIAIYSLGIPLLVRKFATETSGIEVSEQAREYLIRAFYDQITDQQLRLYALHYLQMPLMPFMAGWVLNRRGSQDLLSSDRHRVYSGLDRANEARLELLKEGIVEESPLFLAPESEGIYDSMLEGNGWPGIDIFVPELSYEDLERIQQALGFPSPTRGNEYDSYAATRRKMFPSDYRKTSFWHKDPRRAQAEFFDNNEYELELVIPKYQSAYESGRLGIVAKPSNDRPAGFYMHSHEHKGWAGNQVALGWMVESLLQQRGIAYFAYNETLDTSYSYDPGSEHLIFSQEPVRISPFTD